MDNADIQTGIDYFKSGNKTLALQIFLEVLKKEPKNEIAWLWLAACVEKPEQKRDCFHKILEINPNNTSAQKALAELELQALTESKPVLKNGAVLKCPSCGSVMGKPDHTGLVQCGYCGTTITYHPPVEKIESKNVERFLEICKAALDGSNYDEALQYANKVLEIDPRNVDAWINKAIATFWLTTAANNRYDEAMGYLLKAEQIDRENPFIEETRNSLRISQSNWYLYLGKQEIERGNEIFQIYATPSSLSDAIADSLMGNASAKEHSKDCFIKAMDYYILALRYDPESRNVLQHIRSLYNSTRWINWNPVVSSKVAYLQKMESRDNAITRLPELRKQLQEAEADLAKLKKENGFFTGLKIEFAKNKINSLKQQIAQAERITNSN
jgi:tetratricopeptide (TPR) repeat protein